VADEITVVRVERDDDDGTWSVEFSHPILLPFEGHCFNPSKNWVACSDDDPFDYLETDAIGAFMWGLKVIEKHKERNHA
jgi:hypothetical protein